ncbi:MAG TPA: NADH-quinone oxidoreductase subunit NuoH [Sphingobacteriaceae bacterium]|nr:NADH-quinone oxidoreductase subunit NuoH [Sphingobacteriaceae bacterium]
MWESLPPIAQQLIITVIKVTILLGFVGVNFLFLVWMERKISARMQSRVGPYSVGKHGSLQLLADGVKMLSKEDVRPATADRWIWTLAPLVTFFPAVMLYMTIPISPNWTVGSDLNIGLVYLAAISSFTLVGIFMAGWGSNNKYSLLGSMRAAAQLLAYEIPLVVSVLGVVMMAGSLNLRDIVDAQQNAWYLFPQILGFIVFFIAGLAELNRAPFDMAEAEQELVAGYFTEYSGIRWGLFLWAEYTNMFTISALATLLFLGGWHGPPFLPPVVWFMIKSYCLVFVMMWIRWTLPRVRIDQLMDLGWKFLLPVSLLNMLITGIFVVMR